METPLSGKKHHLGSADSSLAASPALTSQLWELVTCATSSQSSVDQPKTSSLFFSSVVPVTVQHPALPLESGRSAKVQSTDALGMAHLSRQ